MKFKKAKDAGRKFSDRYQIEFTNGDIYSMSSDTASPERLLYLQRK